jgi:hypothetical protein
VRELAHALAVGPDDVELTLLVAALVRVEEDQLAVRRPVGIVSGIERPRRDALSDGAVGLCDEDRACQCGLRER